ncbi:MAG TPA: hypothetical protein VLZ12_06125 [Verrucomicrobiae bacterium]|nr:hypothetical protein [Verrucomicrobiae bacterium]
MGVARLLNASVDLIVQTVGTGGPKPDLRDAAEKLKINYRKPYNPQQNARLFNMRQACGNAGKFSVYVYQGHAGIVSNQPGIAAYTGKICGITTSCPAGTPTYDVSFFTYKADVYFLTNALTPNMVTDFISGKGVPRLVMLIGCESGTSWQDGFPRAGAKLLVYCGGNVAEPTASAAINAFFNTLASTGQATINQARDAANLIIDDYNAHPGSTGQMDPFSAVYAAGVSGTNTFADIMKP